ncbi:MAG: RNA polymerase sigma-70 factor [Bacteroidota bacterium]
MKSVTEEIGPGVLQNIAAGNSDSFRILFDRYKHVIYGHALHFTQSVPVAEEITQDVFMQCWIKKAQLPAIDNFEAWMFTITRNLCFNHLKKLAREYAFKKSVFQAGEETAEPIESYMAVKEQEELLHQAVEQLSPQQKIIFKLNRERGMKNAEIATQLNLSPNTVKTHMVSALRSIRFFFQEHSKTAIQVLLLVKIFQ